MRYLQDIKTKKGYNLYMNKLNNNTQHETNLYNQAMYCLQDVIITVARDISITIHSMKQICTIKQMYCLQDVIITVARDNL